MSLTTTSISSAVPFAGDDMSQGNDITKNIYDALIAAGFVSTLNTVGGVSTPSNVKVKHPNSPYVIQITGSFTGTPTGQGHAHIINILGVSGAILATLLPLNQGNVYTGSKLQGGSIRILSGPNCLLLEIINGDSSQKFAFAFLKFSDSLWYAWSPTLSAAGNGGILDSIIDTIHTTLLSLFYPNFFNGSSPMVPWLVQADGANTVWNVYPESVFSINPAAYSDYNFYVDSAAKNYFKYGNMMITDI